MPALPRVTYPAPIENARSRARVRTSGTGFRDVVTTVIEPSGLLSRLRVP